VKIEAIPLAKIQLTKRNPRRDAADDPDLAGLAASLGTEAHPTLAQLPVVEDLQNGKFRVLAGERRIRAAKMAGWEAIPCIVRAQLDPLEAHNLRVVENLQRKGLHPLDEANALKLAWYNANAQALGLADKARKLLDAERPPAETLAKLEALLTQNGFTPSHPAVAWDDVLDGLGVEMNRERRKKLMQVLGVTPEVQERARQVDMTEASLRSLAQLAPEAQERMIGEIEENPEMARKLRRISHAVRAHDYDLETAIAEAKGEPLPDPDTAEEGAASGEAETQDEFGGGEAGEQVVRLMELAQELGEVLAALQLTPLAELPEPWGAYAAHSIQELRTKLTDMP